MPQQGSMMLEPVKKTAVSATNMPTGKKRGHYGKPDQGAANDRQKVFRLRIETAKKAHVRKKRHKNVAGSGLSCQPVIPKGVWCLPKERGRKGTDTMENLDGGPERNLWPEVSATGWTVSESSHWFTGSATGGYGGS